MLLNEPPPAKPLPPTWYMCGRGGFNIHGLHAMIRKSMSHVDMLFESFELLPQFCYFSLVTSNNVSHGCGKRVCVCACELVWLAL